MIAESNILLIGIMVFCEYSFNALSTSGESVDEKRTRFFKLSFTIGMSPF